MNIVRKTRKWMDRCYNKVFFRRAGVKLSKDVKTFGRIRFAVSKGAKIDFGSGVVIRSGWRENPSGGGTDRTLLCVKSGAELHIGNRSGMSNSTIVATRSVWIGEDVNIGVNCTIYDTDHHSVAFADRMAKPDVTVKRAPVVIEDGAWICGHCIILKGVHIGKRSVIAAGSVVTRDIPDDELWGGNPARFIRKLEEPTALKA